MLYILRLVISKPTLSVVKLVAINLMRNILLTSLTSIYYIRYTLLYIRTIPRQILLTSISLLDPTNI